MKRLIIPGLVLLALLALFQWGHSILENTLDAELPKLLTRELGIPVTLAPTRTRITTLTLQSPKLFMGEPANPALVATGVTISLDWADLLSGEIRLRRVSGDTLMVKPSLWPGNDDPRPTDYRFLDPYLPDHLELDSASYVDSDGNSHAFSRPRWRRQSPGASLSWRDEVKRQAVDISVGLTSLDDLLRLASMKLQVTTDATGKDDSTFAVSLEIQPGIQSGYRLTGKVNAAGMPAVVVAANQRAWEWPDQSATSIKQLDTEKIKALLDRYSADTTAADPGSVLALPLPRLSLPVHRGKVTIDELRWRDEVGTDTVLEFNTGPNGVTIPAVSSHGPTGVLDGQLSITSSDAGWQLAVTAKLEASETGGSLAAPYMDANWFWREGNCKLSGQGDTLDTLLNSLRGDIALSGSHHGAAVTPVAITAGLDNRPEELALDTIEVTLGKGRITGSVALSGEERKRLSGKIKVDQLDLGSLLPAPDPAAATPGIEVPTYLAALPGMDLDWQLDISALTVQGLHITEADASFTRSPQKATLTVRASSQNAALLELHLAADMFPDKPATMTLRTDLSRFDVAQLFEQAAIFPAMRTSGTINFDSRGNDLEQVFRAMQGKADLTIDHRPDQDWARPSRPEEQLQVSGAATLVMAGKRITGLQISELDVDSMLQNLTGTLSIVEGRKPWLEANLTSDKLDLANLAQFKSKSAADAPQSDSLDALRDLGESRLTLKAKTLLAANLPLSDVMLRVSTAPDEVKIEQLDFSLERGRLTSEGGISWRKDDAALSLDATVDNFSLDWFLTDAPSTASVPLSGTISLRSSGATLPSLLADLTGDIRLTASADGDSAAPGAPAHVDMTARQTADGMHAVIHRFQWEGSDLAGSVQYRSTTPPVLEVEISGGSLSLLPWEAVAADPTKNTGKKADGSVVTRTARASGKLIGDVVMAPLRLISGPREAEPGDKLFSTTPLPFERLKKYQASMKGKLDKFISREATASDLEFSAEMLASQLTLEASGGTRNGGSAAGSINIDMGEQPASVALKGTFSNLRGDNVKNGFPRSGHFDVTSHGQSQAELAANVSGLVYVELGAGTLDYGNLMLLTADVATNMFETLIPGADKKQPQLECAVTLGVFKDGIGVTPYGYGARTNLANLVGRVEVNLQKELLHLNFSSSSRKGLGLSMGNVFSNTVEVEGSLTDPKIIPNATGLLWRGWAAIMTGGLSVVGESVLKRTLASENPCTSVRKHIRKDFCVSNAAAAASPMLCPPP